MRRLGLLMFVAFILPTWVVAATFAQAPAPAEPPPARDPNAIYVPVGQSWADAVKAAGPNGSVYLACGGVWNEGLQVGDLKSVTIGAYGSGPAPVVRVPAGSALVLHRAMDVRVSGIEFQAQRPTEAGVRLFGCQRVTLEGLKISGFTFGITVERFNVFRGNGVTVRRCVIRENCDPAGGDSSGIFASGQNDLVITENDIDANGWLPGKFKGKDRNHNVYIAGDCGPVVFTKNRSANASSHGAQIRSGGLVSGNVFIDNPIHLSFGLVNGGGPIVEGGVTGEISYNRFLGSRPLAGTPRGWAVEISNCREAVVKANVFGSDYPGDPKLTGPIAAIKLDLCKLTGSKGKPHPQAAKLIKIGTLTITDDNACTWPGGLVWVGTKSEKLTKPETWPPVDVAALREELR